MLDIKGTFRVTKVNAFSSNIQYQLLFFKDKVLFIKTGGQFAESGFAGAIGAGVGGGIGAGIGVLIDSAIIKARDKKKQNKIKSFTVMSEDELIALDKKNFILPYAEIFNVHMKKSIFSLNGARSGKLIFEGKKKDEYDISVKEKYEDCENVVRVCLGDRFQ